MSERVSRIGHRVYMDGEVIADAVSSHAGAVIVRALRGAIKASSRVRAGKVAGGIARAAALSPERRSEIARKAAAKRWGKTNACTDGENVK